MSGLLALLLHLATEDHFPLPPGAQVAVIRKVCPCKQPGHTPHAAGDHEANQTTDEPRSDSVVKDLASHEGSVAQLPHPPVAWPEEVLLASTIARVPILWKLGPPSQDACRSVEQPRAPPLA